MTGRVSRLCWARRRRYAWKITSLVNKASTLIAPKSMTTPRLSTDRLKKNMVAMMMRTQTATLLARIHSVRARRSRCGRV